MGNTRSSSARLHNTREHLEPQILHSYQKIIMRTVWRHMAQGGHASSGATALKRLMLKEPKIKNVFHHTAVLSRMKASSNRNEGDTKTRTCSLNDHQVEIVRFMQFVMANLDSPSLISIECTRIGSVHRRLKEFGLKAEYWDLLGEALTETIREYQGWRRHRESLRAANLLVSFLVDRIRAGFLQRQSFASLVPPRPILKSSPSREKDLNGNLSRKNSLRRKESVRFNNNKRSDDDEEEEEEIDYGYARAGARRSAISSSAMVRSRSGMGRIEWIDDEDDSPNGDEGRRKEENEEYLNRRLRSSSERRHRASRETAATVSSNDAPSKPPLVTRPPRLLPRTPTIDFTVYASPSLPQSSTVPSLHHRSLSRYHSLDNGYHSCSSPSDGEHSLHRPLPPRPSRPHILALSGTLSRHPSSSPQFTPQSVQTSPHFPSSARGVPYSSRHKSMDNR